MMRLGPGGGPVVVVALPLFEEANRTRTVAVAVMRFLADHGIASALPDMPGQGDSLVPTQEASLFALREAFEGAVDAIRGERRRPYVAAIRGGALLDPFALADGRWHWSPQQGAEVARELNRIGVTALAGTDGAPVAIAGNLVSPGFLDELSGGILYDGPDIPRRVVRLADDPRPADRHLAGAPPWRRAEPGRDDLLAQALAADIADWLRSCDAR